MERARRDNDPSRGERRDRSRSPRRDRGRDRHHSPTHDNSRDSRDIHYFRKRYLDLLQENDALREENRMMRKELDEMGRNSPRHHRSRSPMAQRRSRNQDDGDETHVQGQNVPENRYMAPENPETSNGGGRERNATPIPVQSFEEAIHRSVGNQTYTALWWPVSRHQTTIRRLPEELLEAFERIKDFMAQDGDDE
ncbi:hypothetical protein NW768_004042 [Fusarium equiseti]|uniref:Uncharacterized protein n=1 Tax=Fusarium equiseti TaxID=61235 RepID=A0ABQ8RJF3_FUSEQ|nr:hypothetical protein NW768_004042 [Fusarium equiseti]